MVVGFREILIHLFHLVNVVCRGGSCIFADFMLSSFEFFQEGTVYEVPEIEDPTLYVSEKTGRGALSPDWIEEHWSACKGKTQPTSEGKAIMCAYKLCKVEFRYWGMQSKIERFIHDVALRKTMLKAHSQAWTWQDEWHGLTMEDIRAIERETADLLKKRFAEVNEEDGNGDYKPGYDLEASQVDLEVNSSNNNAAKAHFSSIEYSEADVPNIMPKPSSMVKRKSISENNDFEEDDDEFFDARDQFDESSSLAKWSSMELENADPEATPGCHNNQEPLIGVRRVQSLNERSEARPNFMSKPLIDVNQCSEDASCPTQVLVLVVHGGSVLDGPLETSVRKSDVTTFRGAFETVIRTHYPGLVGQLVIKCVPCPSVCTEALAVLSSLSPYR